MISFFKKIISNVSHFSRSHKKTAIVVIALLIVCLYYGVSSFSKRSSTIRYVVAKAAVGTIQSTVSGSGQVSATSQIDVKSKASGDVLSVAVKAGDTVKTGDVLARIDSTDARIALESAQIAYDKLVKPADSLTVYQSQSSLQSAQDNLKSAQDSLVKSYDGSVSSLESITLDGPTILSDLNNLFNTSSGFLRETNVMSFTDTSRSYVQTAYVSFDRANVAYDAYVKTYNGVSRTSASTTIESAVNSAYEVSKLIATAAKDAKSAVDRIIKNDQNNNGVTTQASSAQTLLATDVTKASSLVSDSFGSVTAISTAQGNVTSSQRSVSEKQQSLTETLAGADVLDIRSQALNLEQKRTALEDYIVRAPVDGVVAKVSVDPLGTVSSGSSVATIISQNKKAVITLNEVDAVKVAAGQKATVTFDAIDNLTINGVVDSIDLVGTVSQGVVSYSASITFTDNDPRIRSGMSATVSIVTESRENVIIVPNTAVKKNLKSKYVEVFDTVADERVATTFGFTSTVLPKRVTVETGLADDTDTEITSGLSGGEYVVKKTTIATSTSASSAPSILSSLRGGSAAGQGGGSFSGRRN
jgi:RND family efflux transporter MFP subunit